MKVYELKPNDNRKSFYGKAKIIYSDDPVEIYLQSYDTKVCKYVVSTGEFVRLWDGYSATTMRHINAFLNYMGINGGGKSWWIAQPVQN